MMDLVLFLREARRKKGLPQRLAAKLAGMGEKTISSFETGARIESMKISQLCRLLDAYGVSLRDLVAETAALEPEFISVSDFSVRELKTLSAITLLLQNHSAAEIDRMLRYLSQGIGSRERIERIVINKSLQTN